MSLLIDALKQAEAARAQAQGNETPAPASGIELEPLPDARSSAVPQAAGNSREANTPTPARDTRSSRPASAAPSTAANQAARELFEVKRQPSNRLPLILAGTGIALLLIGAGYVWWAIQPRSSLIAPSLQTGNGASQAPAASIAVPAPTPAPIEPPSAVAPSPVLVSSPEPVAATPPIASMPRQTRHTSQASPPTRVVTPLNEPKPQTRSSPPAADGNGIQAAYAAFLEGNYALARQRYQDVLRQDPRNVDALNALGMIAWRSGQPDVAERMFRTAVQTDPKDATANAQLALLYAEGDPTAAEGRLRNLIASQPAGAAAHYSLGSLMARQGRWNESQQALFQAYTLDSDNPDILFNLAISLEHLGQSGVARQFYERALQASSRRPAGFDKSVAQNRLQALREH